MLVEDDKYKITKDRRDFWPDFIKKRMIENEKLFGVYDHTDLELSDWPSHVKLPKDDEDVVD